MKSMTFFGNELDSPLVDYNVLSDVSDGARKKIWLEKGNHIFLYKENKIHDSGESTKENFSEYFAMRIGHMLEIPVTNIVLLENAILSERMWDCELKSFLDYSEELSHSFHLSNLTTYDIRTLLFNRNKYRDEIIQVLLFDSLIGNSDRHPGNFLYNEDLGFYPLFDNGSSLCCYVEEDKVIAFLKDLNRFRALCETKSKPV